MMPFHPNTLSVSDKSVGSVKKIRMLIRTAGAFVDQAALFQFGEGRPTGGDGMMLIRAFRLLCH